MLDDIDLSRDKAQRKDEEGREHGPGTDHNVAVHCILCQGGGQQSERVSP